MRVFITGGTGTIGEAVIKELCRAGHAVRGLSRSEASDAKLRALGAMPHRGLLDQPASYQSAAADGVFDADTMDHWWQNPERLSGLPVAVKPFLECRDEVYETENQLAELSRDAFRMHHSHILERHTNSPEPVFNHLPLVRR